MDKYTKAVLTVIAASVLTTSVIAREVNDTDLNNLHALDLETEDLNFTWSLIQFGIRANKSPGTTYIRGIYANEEECYSDLLEVEYLSTFEKDKVTGKFFGIQESMHGISMVACTMNMGIVIKK